jgi:hypothetical protein
MRGPNHALPTDGSSTDVAQGVDTTHQEQDAAARPRLLLIEVDDAIAEVLGAVLDGEGYAVERVVSPQDALTQFLTHDPDGFPSIHTSYPCWPWRSSRVRKAACWRSTGPWPRWRNAAYGRTCGTWMPGPVVPSHPPG